MAILSAAQQGNLAALMQQALQTSGISSPGPIVNVSLNKKLTVSGVPITTKQESKDLANTFMRSEWSVLFPDDPYPGIEWL
jgi:hypothetical protein